MSALQHQTPGNMIPSGHMLGRTPTSQMRLAPAPMTFQVALCRHHTRRHTCFHAFPPMLLQKQNVLKCVLITSPISSREEPVTPKGWACCSCLISCASQIEAGLACLQDFLKEVDLQFLDHMRRGTSINFADLASDPPPATMQAGPSMHPYFVS